MYFTRILLSIVFVLFASTALAAPPEKTLLCHVGNELGPDGSDYLDDPGCVPHEDNDWFCPDAGKIDLIEVAKPAKHLNNTSHMYDGISDYLPEDIGASGEGKEDTDGDGIDDGCEPRTLTCPCWNTFTELELVTAMSAEPITEPHCGNSPATAFAHDDDDDDPILLTSIAPIRGCQLRLGPHDTFMLGIPVATAAACYAEALTVISQITWCSD